ncbi:GbsR/MarR family transcriptional regulator [Agaricicola taiwanensis]|nr:transcriptional regulator [Agaricicola taiwanensis]
MLDAHSNETAVSEFIEEMGILTQADDLPRIAGRIVGLLVIAEHPLSFSDIATSLQVSRASISTNARLLMEIGVIERVAISGDRQDYYRLAPSCHLLLLRRIITRVERMREAVSAAGAALAKDKPAVKARLDGLSQFYSATCKSLIELCEQSEDLINRTTTSS